MKSANPPTQPTLGVVEVRHDSIEHVQQPGAAMTRQPSPAPASFDIEGMFKYALEKSAGPEAMTTLMNIRRELNAEASKKAFDESLSAFQSECPMIMKTRGVPLKSGGIAYKYAPIEMIEEVIRPIEKAHGFTHTFDTDVNSVVGFVIAKCIVTHNAGHTRESSIKLPLGTQTQIMSNTQAYAGAMTFANRRALMNVYGLVLAGEDIDGATTKPRPAGPSQGASKPKDEPKAPENAKAAQKRLWALLKPIVSQVPGWVATTWDGHNAWLRSVKILTKPETKVETLPVEDVLEIIEKAQIILGEM